MFHAPGNRKTFVVKCKRCRRDVPTGLKEFSFQSITVECRLCGELRRYLPVRNLPRETRSPCGTAAGRSPLMFDPDAHMPRIPRHPRRYPASPGIIQSRRSAARAQFGPLSHSRMVLTRQCEQF